MDMQHNIEHVICGVAFGTRLAGKSFSHVRDDVPDLLGAECRTEGRHQISSFGQYTRDRDGVGGGRQRWPAAVASLTLRTMTGAADGLEHRAPIGQIGDRVHSSRRLWCDYRLRAWGVRGSQVSLE